MRFKTLKAINHFTWLMCPQRCLFFLKWRQNQSSWKIKSNPSFTAECYATAFKMHKSVYSRSFATDAWHVHWRRANLEYFYLLSFICGKTPLYVIVMAETCPLWMIGIKWVDGWRQWFPGRSVSSVFHLPGRGGHGAVIFICSTTSSSLPHQPGLVQSNAELCCNLWPVIVNCSTLVPLQRPVHE